MDILDFLIEIFTTSFDIGVLLAPIIQLLLSLIFA